MISRHALIAALVATALATTDEARAIRLIARAEPTPTNFVSAVGDLQDLPGMLEGAWHALVIDRDQQRARLTAVDVQFQLWPDEIGLNNYRAITRPKTPDGSLLLYGKQFSAGEIVSFLPMPDSQIHPHLEFDHSDLGKFSLTKLCQRNRETSETEKRSRCSYRLRAGSREQILEEWWQTEYVHTWPYFVGDVDRDHKPDVIFEIENSCGGYVEVHLSSRATGNQLVRSVGAVGGCD